MCYNKVNIKIDKIPAWYVEKAEILEPTKQWIRELISEYGVYAYSI